MTYSQKEIDNMSDKELSNIEEDSSEDDPTMMGELSKLPVDYIFTGILNLEGKTVREVRHAIRKQTHEGYQFKDILEEAFNKNENGSAWVTQQIEEVIKV